MKRRILKNIMSIVLAGSVANAYAVAPGFYMGIMGGPATNTGGTQQIQTFSAVPPSTTVTGNPRSTQFGSRLYMGYKMNKYASTEMGFGYFSGIHYDTKGVETCSGATARVRDIDFVGKGAMPIGSMFDVFMKAGVALAYQTTSGALNPQVNLNCGKSTYTSKFSPTVSVGASYDLNQSWVVDASWTRLMVGGAASNIDFYGLGISFHIVDVYCGQFLCN